METENTSTEKTTELTEASQAPMDEEEDFKLISQSNEEFNRGEYDKCLETLEQIQTNSDSDKLQHNIAVVKFYQSHCIDHETLLKSLNALNESAFAKYNRAIIYFHRHMHYTALETLSPLVAELDTLDEPLSGLVVALMLRLLLATNQLNKAQAFLEVGQKRLALNTESLVASDEISTPESSKIVVDDVNRTLKLLALTINVLNRKPVVVPDDGSTEFAALKAHQYYIMKDFQMASKQLKKINSETYMDGTRRDELNTCIANNMGVIHLRVRHYAIAAKFFQNAITFDKKVAANLPKIALHQMSSVRSCEILYNLGISMLYLRRPKEAFQCFLIPLKSQHNNPRLWFRMAESCMMNHEMNVHAEEKIPIVSSSATEAQRKNQILKPTSRILYSKSSQSTAVPEPTLEFAALCLRNALILMTAYKNEFHDVEKNDGAKSEDEQNWQQHRDNNFCNPSSPISKEAFDNMLSAIYAAFSYVSLRLGDYVIALEMARKLLKVEKISDAHKMLANMYAGEALMMMDKLAEARPYLEPSFISSLNAFDFETKDWQVKSLNAAQNIVRYNLAVATTMQGDLETALKLLSECTHPIVASKVLSLKMYLDTRMANINK